MTDPLSFKYDEYEQDFQKERKNTITDIQLQYSKKEQVKNEEDVYEGDFDGVSGQETPVRESKLAVQVQRLMDKNPDREKMIEQNIRLKTQVYELAKQMDDIMQREKKQKKYGIHADEEEDEAIKAKKAELKKQQVEIMNLKNKIFLTKRQLEHVYDSRGIQGKEDQLKNLQIQLKTLQDEKEGLLRIKKEQNKALKMIRSDKEYDEKIKTLKEQLGKTKEECKNLSEKLLENERILRKNHQIYIIKQTKIKEMEMKIKENKEKAKKSVQATNVITPAMIEEIDQQIAQIEKEKKEAERAWNEKIQIIEGQLAAKRLQQEKKLLILKEKQKQLKLNEIRIKQLKKLINHHTNESATKHQSEQNMRQFRHKRNIKHLQK